MALLKQNIPISFAQGLDLKDDRKQVIPGRFLTLENAIFQTPGELRKRNGYMALPTQIALDEDIVLGGGLGTFLNELIALDGKNLYSFSEASQQWTDKGFVTSLELSLFPVIRNTYQQTVPDSAQHSSGLQVFTWMDSRGGGRYAIVDSVTGMTILQDQLISATSIKPKPMAIGAYILIFYVETSNNHLKYIPIMTSNPNSPGAALDFATNMDVTNPNYDVALIGNKLVVAYNNSDVGGGITLREINLFLVLGTAQDVTGENGDGTISVVVDVALQQIWVNYYNGTDVKYFIYTYSLTPFLAPTVIETIANVKRIIGEAASGSGQIWYEISAVSPINTLIRNVTLNNTGAVGTPSVFVRSAGIASKPFLYNGMYYFAITFQTTQQPSYFVISEGKIIIAKNVPDSGGGLLVDAAVPEANQLVIGTILFAILQKDLLTTIGGTVYTQTGVTATTLNFLSDNTFYHTEIARNFHVTGGILEMYDGINVVEHGFNVYPENITIVQAGGGALSNGQYQYSVTYEWTDNQGQIHRSAPSVPTTITVTGAGDNNPTLTIPTLRLTNKVGVRIVVYRTEANGTVFYQTTSTTSPLLNNPAVDTVTFNDTTSDATLIGNPLLYTTGGVVDNIAVPAPLVETQYKDRLIVVPSESPISFWYSKQVVPGEPVQFSDAFIQNVDQRGGPITAVDQLDDKLILFKDSLIFYVTGDGPDNTGGQNDFSEAQLITTDSGCINARSLVIMPRGIMYQSRKGIYLLDRSLTVGYIGAPVESFNTQTITSATLVRDTNQVRFTLDSGVTLVYDYLVQQWSVFTNYNAADATVFQNVFTFFQPNGLVMQETPGIYTDNNQFIKMKAVTSWLSVAGLQGFQRCYRALFLGEFLSPHQLLIQTAYDFNPTFVQQDYINAGNLFSLTAYGDDSPYGNEVVYGGAYPYYQFRIDLRQQKCQAIQFSIEDLQSSDFGQGFSISAVNLMVGAKQGSNKLPPSNIYA